MCGTWIQPSPKLQFVQDQPWLDSNLLCCMWILFWGWNKQISHFSDQWVLEDLFMWISFFLFTEWVRSSLIDINSLGSSTFVNTGPLIYKQTTPEDVGKAVFCFCFFLHGFIYGKTELAASANVAIKFRKQRASAPLLTKLGRGSLVTSLNSHDSVQLFAVLTSCWWVLKLKGGKKELLFFLSSTILKSLGHKSLKLWFTF